MICIWKKTIWWKQLLFIIIGCFIASCFGAMLMSPTGPGSDRILYAVLAGYAFLLVLLGPKFTKITGVVLLCLFIGGFVNSTMSKINYHKKMKAWIEQMQKSHQSK